MLEEKKKVLQMLIKLQMLAAAAGSVFDPKSFKTFLAQQQTHTILIK